MNRTLALLAAVAGVAFAAPSFAADTATYETKTKVKADDDGDYKETTTTESKDMAGTKTESESKVDVDAKADGSVEKTVTTEKTSDPKGLGNKTKVKTKDTVKTDAAGNTMDSKHKKTVNGKTVEDTESKAH